ncbi:MAG: hypothetical protein QOE98_3255 [Gaiellaceae bacterium]|jgi:hypothetical protein|nr:hypothetical protein [Gaiellaceae bacterium]
MGVAGSGPNMYSYAAGSPTNFTDPTGLFLGIDDLGEHVVGAMDGATFGLTNTIRDGLYDDGNIECTSAYQESYSISNTTTTVVVAAGTGYGGAGLAAEAFGGSRLAATLGGGLAGGGTQSGIQAATGHNPGLGGTALNVATSGGVGYLLGPIARPGIEGLVSFTAPLNGRGIAYVGTESATNTATTVVTGGGGGGDSSGRKGKCGE